MSRYRNASLASRMHFMRDNSITPVEGHNAGILPTSLPQRGLPY